MKSRSMKYGTGKVGVGFAHAQNLLPWDRVRDEWNRRSGQTLTAERIRQISTRAHHKMLKALTETFHANH